MSSNAALIDLHIPADPTSSALGRRAIAGMRRLVGCPRWSQEQPYLKIGPSFRIPDGRRRDGGGSSWVHTRH